jgi:putative membrane protein
VLARVLPDVDPHRARAFRPPRRALAKAPLSYLNLGVWSDDRYVVCSSGRLQRVFVLVPLAKVQSLRFVQGPYARALRLATVHVDLVGSGWRAAAAARDAEEAEAMWPSLAERARHARQAFAEPVGSRSAVVASDDPTPIVPHA